MKKQRKAQAEAKIDAEADYERAPRQHQYESDSDPDGEEGVPLEAIPLPIKTPEGELMFPKVEKKVRPQQVKEGISHLAAPSYKYKYALMGRSMAFFL